MTRYFFDLENDDGFLKDQESRDLADGAATRQEVAFILQDVVHDELDGNAPFTALVIVRNDRSEVVTSAKLSFQIH